MNEDVENVNGIAAVENALEEVDNHCLVADMNIVEQDRECLGDGSQYLGQGMVDYMADPVRH